MMEAYTYIGLSRNDQLVISPFKTAERCGKKDCYFCYMMFGVKQKKAYPVRKTELKSPRWTFRETQLLKERINMPTIDILKSEILPGRRESAINQMKTVLRKRYGIKVRDRIRSNGALAIF